MNIASDYLNDTIVVGLIVWDEQLRIILEHCFAAFDDYELRRLPNKATSVGPKTIDELSNCDILIIQAYNSTLEMKYAEGFQLAKIIYQSQSKIPAKPLIMFTQNHKDLVQSPCFIDNETLPVIREKIEILLSIERLDKAMFSRAEAMYPELKQKPKHDRGTNS